LGNLFHTSVGENSKFNNNYFVPITVKKSPLNPKGGCISDGKIFLSLNGRCIQRKGIVSVLG
jgi:hypothetical protein